MYSSIKKSIKNILEKILKRFGYKIQQIINHVIEEATQDEIDLMKLCDKYSMTSDLRKWALIQSFHYIINNNIEGDFVECGVWKGGNLILLKKLMEKKQINNKKIYGFDTFEGMSEASIHDIKIDKTNANVKFEKLKQKDSNNINWNFASENEVINNFKDNVEKNENLKLIKGKVEDTLLNNDNIPEKISILRLDTDFYESTKTELEKLYPKLSIGGVLIIDDYGSWQGSRKAVDEYFQNKKIWLHYIDHDGRLLIKK